MITVKDTKIYSMSKRFLAAIAIMTMAACAEKESTKPIEPVDFSHVKIQDAFWSPRLKALKTTTLPVCMDQIENKTGRIRNFENAAKGEGEHSGIFFDDSDVYKALEGIAYSLINNPDPELEAKADEWIDKFAAAQQEDGYINTYYTLTGLDERWTNMDKHEMYCAGHMTEAAVAYYKATGKRKLLDVSIRMADHMMDLFGPGKRHWVPGHEEIELALVKLFEVTGESKYLDFAKWLIDERGHGHGFLDVRTEKSWRKNYYQDEMPVVEMEKIQGHAVRCMYLYCGMADVAAYTGDEAYLAAMDRLWNNVTECKMYVTGGIGSSKRNEGFTEDFDLPNYEAYCETCASVGMVLWNSRMNQFSGDSKYVDILERALFNGVLSGINLEGDRFFYVNPLASRGDHHRKEWYGCACCPSQLSRFLPSVGSYIYGCSDDAVWVNLFIGNTAEFKAGGKNVSLKMETEYPWNGSVKLTVCSPLKKDIRLRIPSWCRQSSIMVNGAEAQYTLENGYAVLSGKWKAGDVITLDMDMPVEVVAADPRVKEDVGKRCLQRGPVVYCMEEVDNPEFDKLSLSQATTYEAGFKSELLNGVVAITASEGDTRINFIPYYAWDNREAGQMQVWVNYNE